GLILLLCLGLRAQTCVPTRILPIDQASGALDDSSCLLSDGTAYAAYRLDLSTRGKIQIDITGGPQLILQNSSGVKVDSGGGINRGVEAGSYTIIVNGRGAYSLQ